MSFLLPQKLLFCFKDLFAEQGKRDVFFRENNKYLGKSMIDQNPKFTCLINNAE